MTEGPLDLVRAEIMRRLGPEIDARFAQLTPILVKALNNGEALPTVKDPKPAATLPPKVAGGRTLVQGLVAVILAAIVGVVSDALSSGTFQVFEWDSWTGLGSVAAGAIIMAILAFGQRLIGR